MIAIIDYGAGNLRSVVNAVSSLGYETKITSLPDDVISAQAVIFPGVGVAADTMINLKKLGLASVIRRIIGEDKPFFGICIGLQVLFSGTEEGGWQECLDIVPGRVNKLPSGLKIPHMGWNQVKQKIAHPVFEGVPDETNFYFVHSYYAQPEDRSLVAGETDYGISFCSAVARGNLVATQFHPEKSGEIGLRIFDNFIRLALEVSLRSN
ncbi:MAG: imidazole glycerol phosphate synthase subunit HisH [Dehalococcoidales bacterium]|mgnify:FL=1|nr:imidazole glycerol phosphate synthase subunit HisH [Dehalococcoidales bacterium]